MHNTFVRSSLIAWQADATLTALELWQLDQNGESAVNGDDGGTWAPSAEIIIGGAGLEVQGPLVVADCVNFEQTNGVLLISAPAVLRIGSGGLLEAVSGADVDIESGATLNVDGTLDIGGGGDLNIFCTAEVESGGGIQFLSGSALATASGSGVLFSSGTTMTIACDHTQTGKRTRSGSGGRDVPRVFSATNLNPSIGVGDCDLAFITMNDGNNHSCTLKVSTGPAPTAGEEIVVRRIGVNDALSISCEVTGIIAVIPTGDHGSGTFRFDGTQWRFVGGHNCNPTSIG